jgi:hypothetical protein
LLANGFRFFPWVKERKAKEKKRNEKKNNFVQNQSLFFHPFSVFFFSFSFLLYSFTLKGLKKTFFANFFFIYENLVLVVLNNFWVDKFCHFVKTKI